MKLRSGDNDAQAKSYRWRSTLILGLVVLGAVGLVARAVELQLLDHGFLAKQGDDRSMRVVKIAAHRGAITDRNGEPLAVSTPVDSVWVNPQELNDNIDQLPRLAKALKEDQQWLARRITSNLDREFLYLVRHMPPDQAAHIKALGIPGVYLMREYRRYYPAGEVAGHVIGFTTVDDKGQEGLELGFDQLLNGEDGAKRVIQDMYGHYVENVESISAPRPGRDLVTSIDLRIQYLAYRELKAAMQEYRARAGSVIVIDVDTGEVLAMVNQPSFNPNDRDQLKPELYRNRAATDIFEPGSSVKPFIMAAALASGQYRADSVVDTSPGFFKVGNTVEEDEHNLGVIDLATILAKSSNVGTAKVALSLQAGRDLEHAQCLGPRPGDRQRLPRRVGRDAEQLFALAPGRHRHAVAWLRPRRSRRCSWRMPTPPSAPAGSSGPFPSSASRVPCRESRFSIPRWRTRWCS